MTKTNDIRPLEWRDLPLLHRLRDRGLCLDARLAYTRGPHPLQTALLDAITPGRGELTLIAPDGADGKTALVGQLGHEQGTSGARIEFLAPATLIEDDGMLLLVDSLAAAAGRRGAHHLIADVDASSKAFDVLRRVGFAVYARQRIWRLPTGQAPELPDEPQWQPKAQSDEPSVTRLYFNIVPGLVQQVEIPPSGEGLVYWSAGELHAYLDLHAGPLGIWVQPYLHPAAQDPSGLLAAAFARLADRSRSPIYLCVRSYQGWMDDTLGRIGLEPCADQAVMVKRLTVTVRERSQQRALQLDPARPEPSAPFAPTRNKSNSISRMDRLKL